MRYHPFDYEWRWDWQEVGAGDETDAGIYFMPREGHAYSICRCPKYLAKKDWESIANRTVECVNSCKGIGNPRAIPEVVAALKGLTSLHTTMLKALCLKESVNDPYQEALRALERLQIENN